MPLLCSPRFQIRWSKVVDPCQCLTFLSITITTISNMLTLPNDKLLTLQSLLSSFQGSMWALAKQLHSLTGKLNWACQAVPMHTQCPSQITTSSQQNLSVCRLDFLWWLPFYGHVAIPQPVPIINVEVDACIFHDGWCCDWPFTTRVKKLPYIYKHIIIHSSFIQIYGFLWNKDQFIHKIYFSLYDDMLSGVHSSVQS